MNLLAYLKSELGVKAAELMDFKKQLSPEEWEALKEDARKDAESKGIELDDEVKEINALIDTFGKG